MSRPPATILAGGRSNRMGGGDKALADIGGQTLLARIVGRLSPQAGPIAVNANGHPKRFGAFDLPVLADATQTFDGPLAGILVAMNWARGIGASHVLTVAGDTPFFPDELVDALSGARSRNAIAVASSRGRIHPTFAIWPVALRGDLEGDIAAGTRRLNDFIAGHQSVVVPFPDMRLGNGEDIDPFFNVNTPGDLAEARRIAQMIQA